MAKRNAAWEVWDYLRGKRGGATIAELVLKTRRPESTIRKASLRLLRRGYLRRDVRERVHVYRRAPKRDWGEPGA